MKRALIFLIFLPLLAFGQGSVGTGTPVVTNPLGQPLPGATVAVCNTNPGNPTTGGCPGNLVMTYTDITLAHACTGTNQPLNNSSNPTVGAGCSNPGTVDGVGNVIAFGQQGQYWCEYYGGGLIGVNVVPCIFPGTSGLTGSNNTWTGTNSFTGPLNALGANLLNCKNFEGVRCIDSTNSQGWTGSDAGAWINAAVADIGSGNPGVIQIFIPTGGTLTASTLVTIGNKQTLRFWGGGTFVNVGIRYPDSLVATGQVSEIDCPDHATLQLAASANVDLISPVDSITSWTGSGNSFGAEQFTLRGCRLDGNKANEAAMVTRTAGTVSNVARATGVATINFSNSPNIQVGDRCRVTGVATDGGKFLGRFIAVASTPSSVTFNEKWFTYNTVGTTGTSGTVQCYSASNGLNFFGRRYIIEDVVITNNVGDGIWTEGPSSTPFSTDADSNGSTLRRVHINNSGGNGITDWGPQNASWQDIEVFNHGQSSREVFVSLRSMNFLAFLPCQSVSGLAGTWIANFGAVQSSNDQDTAATPCTQSILIDSGAGDSHFFAQNTGCNSCAGVEVRSVNQQFAGVIANTNNALKLNGGGGSFFVNVFSNSGTLVTLTSESGASTFIITGDTTSNSGCFSTAPGNPDFVLARTSGGTNCNTFQNGTSNASLTSGGWTQAFPTGANSTLAALGIAQTWTAAQTLGAGGSLNASSLLISPTLPTISTHFNTSGDSIVANGTASFTITVGSGTANSAGSIALPTATNGWNCHLENQSRADQIQQTGSTTTSASFTNFGTTFASTNWTAGDVLRGGCTAN